MAETEEMAEDVTEEAAAEEAEVAAVAEMAEDVMEAEAVAEAEVAAEVLVEVTETVAEAGLIAIEVIAKVMRRNRNMLKVMPNVVAAEKKR